MNDKTLNSSEQRCGHVNWTLLITLHIMLNIILTKIVTWECEKPLKN